ncbi:MAG: hypothetical protein KGH59_03420 [Candidatus Micrarchaeota archaeon]|nr:hypothetical protein [Candidatus Micrarchaeota archaeon]
MSTYRVKLNDEYRLRIFDELKLKHGPSLRKICHKFGYSYSALKKWRAGRNLIPENILNELINAADINFREELKDNIVAKLPENWGAAVGGRACFSKYRNKIRARMKYIRKFKPSVLLPKVDNETWEIVGICLGDGCISKYFSNSDKRWIHEIVFTGNMKDDISFYNNVLLPLLKKKFGVTPKPHFRPDFGVIVVAIRSKKIFNFLKNLGMPVGKKLDKIRVTKKMRMSNGSKAAILRGLLDTDGHLFARKDEDYKYPYIKITSGSNRFLNDLKSMIKSFGLPAYIHGNDVQIRGGKNLNLWMKVIGTSHPMNINRYKTWLYTGKLIPKKGLVV